MVADPTSPIVAAGMQRVALPLVESPNECLALITAIAGGERHRLASLAAHVVGATNRSSVARVVEALETFRRSGMLLSIDADAVRAHPFVALASDAIEQGVPEWQVWLTGSTASTSSDLSKAVRQDSAFAKPRLIATEFQHAGRGRLGRRWSSSPGASLTASFALPIERPLARIDGVTLVCGLAVRDVVAAHRVTATLKWPNDVLCDGSKLAGILVEGHPIDAGTALVVGVGLNVGPRDVVGAERTGLPSTDLVARGGRALDRNVIVGEIAMALQARLAAFAREGFEAFVDEWNRADALGDRPVALHDASGGARTGVARGVDARGALLVDIDGVRTRVISGDVSVRPVER